MPHSQAQALQHEEIGRYRPGRFYSESFSGIPYEIDISIPTSVGRNDSFNPYCPDPGGPLKTLRIAVFLHETAHFVHDMSLGACMEIDYLTDAAIGAFLQILHMIPHGEPFRCPILGGQVRNRLKVVEGISAPLAFLEEREALASALLSKPCDLPEFAFAVNPIFRNFPTELDELSGLSLLEGLVAVKTLVAMTLRVKDEDDAAYLQEMKDNIPLLPERLPPIYNIARRFFDWTIGGMLGISTKYYGDAWPHLYSSSPRSISDEGFLYLTDMALHIPPFEYSVNRIRKGVNRWDDFIPVNRFVREIDALLRKGSFPPLEDPSSPNQFYRTVFDFVAEELGWPSYEETNHAWIAKLNRYKQERQEAADGYRLRMLVEKHLRPSDIVVSDCVEACVSQFIPILHLTPAGLKRLGGFATESKQVYLPFEEPDMAPYYVMRRNLALWKDAPPDATIDVLPAEFGNQELFRQEIVYRIVARELKDAVLYGSKFSCPFAGLGCEVASGICGGATRLDAVPAEGCGLRFYAEQKQITLSQLCWSQ